jgi:pimeloyl-ACP methyl ester carboxylesterase
VLGSAFVATYPELVRAAVLDGAYESPGYGDLLEQRLIGVRALDGFITRLFEECDASPDCPIEGGAQAAFGRVSAAADLEPLHTNSYFPALNQQAFLLTIRLDPATYGGSADRLLEAVAEADAGNSLALQVLYNQALDFLELAGSNAAITCLDFPYRGPIPLPDDAVARIQAAAPTLEAVFPTPEGYDPSSIFGECERWPAGPDLLPDSLAVEGAGPILVVTSTGDPVTPADSAAELAARLTNSTLLIAEHNRHGSYSPFAGDAAAVACATDLIERFLKTLEAPPAGTICSP